MLNNSIAIKIRKLAFSPICVRLLTVALSFISNILIHRSLGLELKGQYTTILNYANFFQLLLNCGICYAYPLFRKDMGEIKAKETLLTIISLQTMLFGGISIIIIFFSLSIKLTAILLLSVAMICNSQIVFVALIDNIKTRNVMLLLSTVFYIVLNLLAIVFYPGNLYVIVILLILKNMFESLLCGTKNHYFVFVKSSLSWRILQRALHIGVPTAVFAVLISCNYNITIFMLNWMDAGDLQIGVFGVAYTLSTMLWILPDAFKELIYNKTANKEDHRFVLKCIKLNILVSVVVCGGFALLGKWFLGFVYGSEFSVAFDVTLTLFIGIVPMVVFKLVHPIYVNAGRSSVVICLLSISVVINICLSFFLIPKYGAYGAAIASVISYCACGALFFWRFYQDYYRNSKPSTGSRKQMEVRK